MKWFIANPKARVVGVYDPATGDRVDAATMRRRVAAMKSAMTRTRGVIAELEAVEAKLRRSLKRASRERTVDRLEAAVREVGEALDRASNALWRQESTVDMRTEALLAAEEGAPRPVVPKKKSVAPARVKGRRVPHPERKGAKGGNWIYRISFNYTKSYQHGGRQTAQVDVFVRLADGKRAKRAEDARDALYQYIRTGEAMPGWEVERVAWQHRAYDEKGRENPRKRKTNAGVTGREEMDAHLRFFTVNGAVRPGYFRGLIVHDNTEAADAEAFNLNTDGWVIGEEDADE